MSLERGLGPGEWVVGAEFGAVLRGGLNPLQASQQCSELLLAWWLTTQQGADLRLGQGVRSNLAVGDQALAARGG